MDIKVKELIDKAQERYLKANELDALDNLCAIAANPIAVIPTTCAIVKFRSCKRLPIRW
jgi:hypothetical protein